MSNTRGTVAMAADAFHSNTRGSMIYINMIDNSFLDVQGYAPVGRVVSEQALEVLQALDTRWMESIYIPMAADGGLSYLQAFYPGLSYVTKATILEHSEIEAQNGLKKLESRSSLESGSSSSSGSG